MIVTVFLILASINFLQHLFIRFLLSSFSFNEKTTFPNTSSSSSKVHRCESFFANPFLSFEMLNTGFRVK